MSAPSFVLVDRRQVPSLGLEVSHYRHGSGAEHWHLGCSDEHRAFVVAFRTPPSDSTGLPHILEHTTLCGSRRYPVRDPFFQMLRRSLQTFMNAMTFPDLTAYPFASQVPKDFDNLLSVYLDAVFAPNLHHLDFAQEGHRLEPVESGWERKGVVYNEMKGAMDSTSAQMDAARERVLLADTIYRHNSGGEPADIPRLTHADLLAFHRRCYCAANACFVTYGNAEPHSLQDAFARYIDADPGVAAPAPAVTHLTGPFADLDVAVPQAEGQDLQDVSAISLTWVQGDSAALDEALDAELVDRLLLGHAGAPLRLALEGSGLGRSVAHSGYSSSYRNGLFVAELEGVQPEDYPRFVPLVEGCLSSLAEAGLPAQDIEAALHQLELSRREISGDSYPYGLELCFRVLSPWNNGVDPLPFLDQGDAITRLRARATAPGYLRAQLTTRFIANPRRMLLRARPDPQFHAVMKERERAQVEADLLELSSAGQQGLRAQARELATRQERVDDPTVLPDLELKDIPAVRHWAEGQNLADSLTSFVAGTNGILHHLAAFEIPQLSEDELDLLSFLPRLIGSLGVGAYSYDEHAAQLNRICGGLGTWSDVIADPEDERRVRGFFIGEIKGLAHRSGDYLGELAQTLTNSRFDEHDRIRELIDERVQRLQASIQQQGNRMAARAAMRGFGGAAALPHRMGGLGSLSRLKALAALISADAPGHERHAAELSARLGRLLWRLTGGERHAALIGDAAGAKDAIALVRQAWSMPSPADSSSTIPLGALPMVQVPNTAYLTATAVNYCALSFSTVGFEHPDAAALAVAGPILTNQVLHPKLREQGGAYNGSASAQSSTATFTLSSYRDPRLDATFSDMRDGLRWLAACPDDPRLLKEAVLGVVASLDSPSSPAGEARNRFVGDLKGVGPALLNKFRAQVLAVTPLQVRAAASRWLPAEGGTLAVVTGQEQIAASQLSWVKESI